MSILISSPLSYLGVFLMTAGFFLLLSGLNIIRVEKITLTTGRRTLIVGLLLAGVGLGFLIGDNRSPAFENLAQADLATPIPTKPVTSLTTPALPAHAPGVTPSLTSMVSTPGSQQDYETTLVLLYNGLKLQNLTVQPVQVHQGVPIQIYYEITNTTDQKLIIPLTTDYAHNDYLIGSDSTWIERLGEVDTIFAFEGQRNKIGNRYSDGGLLINTKKTLPDNLFLPGQAIPFSKSFDTAELDPGRYRYSVDYLDMDRNILQTVSVIFEVIEKSKSSPNVDEQMAEIYQSMQLDNLTITPPSVKKGEAVVISFEIVNTSELALLIPANNQYSSEFYLIGSHQGWIERLGNDPQITAFEKQSAKDGNRYAAGGAIIPIEDQFPDKTIHPGESIKFTREFDTGNLPAGRYRFYIQYRDLDTNTLQEADGEFEVTEN